MKLVTYLLVGVAAALVAAALVAYMLYGGSPWPAEPPRVAAGGQWRGVFRLKPWGLAIRRGAGSWWGCQDFELRVLEEGGVKSVLIRGTFVKNFTEGSGGGLVQSSSEELLYSDAYAVTLDGAARVRAVDEAAWSRARALTPEESETEYGAGAHRMVSYYEGGTLPRGEVTGGGLPLTSLELGGAEPLGWFLSQGGRYVAGFSHTSRRRLLKRPSIIPFSGEDDRIIAGTTYVDLFDGATGRRLARATKGHKESYQLHVFRQAVWFEGHYFVMPLDNNFEGWLVGALPE